MPIFVVKARQFVEEIAELEVEADTIEDAMQEFNDESDWDWHDGDEVKDFEVLSAVEIDDDDSAEEDEEEDEDENFQEEVEEPKEE